MLEKEAKAVVCRDSRADRSSLQFWAARQERHFCVIGGISPNNTFIPAPSYAILASGQTQE